MNKKEKLSLEIDKILTDLENRPGVFKYNQKYSLMYLAKILKNKSRGVVIADEVGLGKTRIGIFAMLANALIGESSIVLVPPGLIHQWISEWNEVIDQLKMLIVFNTRLESICEPIKIQRIDDVYLASQSFPIADKDKPKVIIIPHTLNLYIRMNADIDYIDLPQVISAQDPYLSNNSNARVYFNKWYKNSTYDYGKGKEAASAYLYINQDIYNEEELDLIKSGEFHFRERKKDNYRYNKYIERFYKNGPGFTFLFKSFFKLIGKCSLLIVDEAHKSKSETGHEKVLGNIIAHIKDLSKDIFTIGMTATPVELSPREWSMILRRVGEDVEKTEIIDNFHSSLRNIRLNPSRISFQLDILQRSKDFERFLNKNVTRRVRSKQDDYVSLIQSTAFDKNSPFPHHSREIIPIKLEELKKYGSNWLDLTFSFESLSKCLRGNTSISLRKAKLFDKAFVRGDLNSSSLKVIKDELKGNVGSNQDKRVLFWINQLISSIEKVESENLNHPRVDKTIEVLEKIILNNDGTFNDEKVLIFGTFSESTRILNEKINARFSLRLVDQGMLFPIGEKYIEHLSLEFENIDKSIFNSNLHKFKGSINNVLKKYRKIYLKFREKINDNISSEMFKDESFIGDAFFKDSEKRCKKAKDFFSYITINNYLTKVKVDLKDGKFQEVNISSADIEQTIKIEWHKIVSAFCSNEDFEFDVKSSSVQGENFETKRLDAFIDVIDDTTFTKILNFALGTDDMQGGEYSNYTSRISRRIYGSTPMNTRKNVQNQFNDSNLFPKILVAQSKVGREGLNLHRACRNLILFHQEWNPGVIEQQIGRIDRIASYWEKLLKEWNDTGKQGPAPKIKIFNIVFEGTYDEHQSFILNERSINLKAQLYGGVLTEDILESVSDDFKKDIKECAPDFSPKKHFYKYNSE